MFSYEKASVLVPEALCISLLMCSSQGHQSTIAMTAMAARCLPWLCASSQGSFCLVHLRSGFLHILDYKPEARKEKHAMTQLTIYAMALSRRTGIPVKAFTCTYFDERDYLEFFPLPSIYPWT